ncbi:MAG TPA: zinc ribbon domain-containing protein [Thermoplasmata archaeon]|nr:zinc ribbon domain-containing protein [Thermoplasmata archaeon]
MVACPACGTPVPAEATACPRCHLATSLFSAVVEAAGNARGADPTYLRTIAELISTLDLTAPATVPEGPVQGLLARPARFPALSARAAAEPPSRTPEPVAPLRGLPGLPPATGVEAMRHRIEEYFALGRRLDLDFTEFERRYGAAKLTDDEPSLDALVREMFVHLASSLAEEYDSALARRNELAPLVPTPSADVEFEATRRALADGDLAGAQRRLAHVRDTLGTIEEEWAAGRILLTECDLLTQTARDLGVDPAPALGPFEEGRSSFSKGKRQEAERLLARAAVALWAVIEPPFFDELRRQRDRLVQQRAAGVDIGPALTDLKEISTELRQRNFAGMLFAFRRLRAFGEGAGPAVGDGSEPAPVPETVRPTRAD